MGVSLISPLRVDECRSQLEEAGKTDAIACHLRGRGFTLQMKDGRSAAFLRGEFSEDPAGTVITCSTGTGSSSGQSASLWFKVGLPVFLLFTAALFLNGYLNGFTRNLAFGLVLAMAIPVAYSALKLKEIRQSQREQKELLVFLQTRLRARAG